MPSKKRVTQFGTRLSATADQEYLTDSAASLSIAPPSSSIASSRAGTRRSDRAARSTYSQRSDREYDATEERASADTDMYPQKKKSGVASSSKSLAPKSGSYLSSRTVGSSSKSKHHSRKIIESDDDEEDDDANYRDSGGAGGDSDDELNASGSRSRLVLTISKSKLQNPSSHPTGGPASSSAKKITKKRPPSPETADASKSLKKAASSAGKSHKKSSSKTAAAVVGASSGKRKGESQNADSKYCDDTSEEEDNISLDDDSDSSEDSVHVDERAEEGSDEEIINDADADAGSRYQTDADASLLDDASAAGTDDADNAEAVPATRAEKTAGRGGVKRKGAASAATSTRGKGYKAVKFRWLTDEEALKAQSELWVPQFIAEGPIDEDMLTSIDDAVAVESIISEAVKNQDLPPLSLPPSADDLFINKSLVPRALHVYEGLRRFLPIIRLTGFCVEEFCAALACKENNNLLAEIFMSLIRSVVRNAEVNNIWLVAPEERDALNASLCLMDCITWPQVIVRIKNYLGDAEHVDKLGTILSQRTFPCVEPAMLLDVMECLFNKFLTTHQVHEETTNAQDIDELDLQSEDEQLNDAENSADGSKPTDIECGSAPMRTRAKRKAWKVLPLVSMRSIQEDNCRQCGKQGNLMCCDGCPAAYHQECVGLSDVPAGKWFCDPCNNSYVEGVSDMDLIYSRVRNAHIGCDRSGRRYWFVCSRIVVERQRSDPAIVKMPNDDETLYFYYSTPAQLDELIRLLSVEYEGNLKSFFKEHRSIIADLMQKNLDHTRERLVRQSLQAKKSHLEMLEEQARQRLQAMSPEVEDSAAKQAGTDDDDEDEEMKDTSQETKALDAEHADAGPSTTPVPGEALAGVVAGPLTRMQTGTITAKSYRPVALPVRLAATHAGGRAAADARRYGRAAGPLSTHTNFKMHDPPTLSGHAMSALASPHYRLGEMGEFRRFVNYYNYDGKGKRVMSPEDRHRLQSFVTRFHLEHVPMNLSGNAMFVGGGAAPINFIWNKPVLGTTASLIEAMKGEIVLMESQIPTFAMHPLWAPYRAEWLKRVKSFRNLLQPQNDDDVTFHELAQLLHRLVLGLRKRCFTKTWNELFGFISCSPVTAAEREETKKLDRRRHREQEDIFHLKRTSLIQVTRTKHAIYKIKGEEYRVTGYGGPCWVRAGRRDVNLFADRPKEDDSNDVERFNVLRGALNDGLCTRNGENRKNRDWYEKLVADATERQQQNAAAGNKRTASGSSVSPPLTTNQCEDLIAKDFGTLPSFADTSASESMQTDAGLGRPISAAAPAMKIATSPASARLFSITSETSVHPLVNRLLQTRIDAQTFFYDAHAKAVAAASVAATTPSKGSVDMGKENRPAGEETAADTAAASATVPSITAVSLAAKPQFSNAYDRIVMPDHLPPDAYKTFAGPNFARYPNKEAARDAAPLRLRGLPALRASVPVQSIFSSLDVDELNRLIRVGGQVDVDGYKYDIKNSNYWHYLPGPRPLLAAQVRYSISTSTSLPDLFMAFKFVKVCIQFALLHGGVHVPKPGNPITSYIPKPLRIEGTDIDMELDAGHAILSTQAQPAGMRWHYVMEMRQSGKFNPEQYFRTRDLFVPQVKKPSNMIGSFPGSGAVASCGPSQGVGSGRKETKGSRQSERHKTLRRLPPSSITDTTSIDPQQLVEDNRDWVHEASMPLEEIGTTLELLKFPEADLQKAFDNVEKVKMRGEKPAPPVTPTNLQFNTPNSLNVKLDKKGGPTQVTLLLPGGGRQQYSTFGGNGGMIQMHPPSSQQQSTIAGSLNLGPALLQQRVTAGADPLRSSVFKNRVTTNVASNSTTAAQSASDATQHATSSSAANLPPAELIVPHILKTDTTKLVYVPVSAETLAAQAAAAAAAAGLDPPENVADDGNDDDFMDEDESEYANGNDAYAAAGGQRRTTKKTAASGLVLKPMLFKGEKCIGAAPAPFPVRPSAAHAEGSGTTPPTELTDKSSMPPPTSTAAGQIVTLSNSMPVSLLASAAQGSYMIVRGKHGTFAIESSSLDAVLRNSSSQPENSNDTVNLAHIFGINQDDNKFQTLSDHATRAIFGIDDDIDPAAPAAKRRGRKKKIHLDEAAKPQQAVLGQVQQNSADSIPSAQQYYTDAMAALASAPRNTDDYRIFVAERGLNEISARTERRSRALPVLAQKSSVDELESLKRNRSSSQSMSASRSVNGGLPSSHPFMTTTTPASVTAAAANAAISAAAAAASANAVRPLTSANKFTAASTNEATEKRRMVLKPRAPPNNLPPLSDAINALAEVTAGNTAMVSDMSEVWQAAHEKGREAAEKYMEQNDPIKLRQILEASEVMQRQLNEEEDAARRDAAATGDAASQQQQQSSELATPFSKSWQQLPMSSSSSSSFAPDDDQKKIALLQEIVSSSSKTLREALGSAAPYAHIKRLNETISPRSASVEINHQLSVGMNRDYLTQTTTSEKLCILGAVKASHTTATERLMYKSTPLQPTSANTSHQTTKLVYMSPVPQPLFERNVREPTISIDTKSAGGPTQIVLCQQRRSGGGAGGSAAQPSSQSINHVSHCFGSTLPNNTALRAMPACMTSSSIQQQSNSNNNAGLIVTQEKKQVLSNSLAMGRRIGDRIRRIAGLACAVGYPGGPNAATPLGVPKSELANSYLQLYEKTGSPSSIIEAALAKDQHLYQRLPKQAAEQIVAKSGSQSPSLFLLEQQEAGPIDIIEPADTDVTSVPNAVDAVAENPVVDESIPAEQVSAEITAAAHIDESVTAPAPNALLVSEITGAVDVTTEAVTAGDEEQQPLTEQPQEIVAEVAPLVEGEEDGETKMNRHYPFKVSAQAHAPTTHRHRTGTVYTVQPPPTTTVFVPQNLLFGSAAEQIQIPPLHQLSTVHGRVEEEKAFLNALLMTTLPPPSAATATAAPAIATSSTQAQAVVATLSVATTPVGASAAEESSAQLLQKQQQHRNKQLPPPPMPVLLPTPPPPPINPTVSAMQYLQQAAEAVLKAEINRANGDEPVAEAESAPTDPAALSDVAAAVQSDAAASTPAEHSSASADVADQQVQQQQIGTIASRLSSTADLNATGESQLLRQQADGADIGGTMVLSDADAYNTQLILSSSAGSTPSLVTAYAAPTLPTRGGKRASATTGAGAVGAAAGGRRNARNAIQHPPSSAIGVVDGESAKHGGRYQHLTPKNNTRTAAANAARRERYAAQRASGSGKRSRDAMEAHDQDENDEDENEDREYAGAHDSIALENRLLKSFPPGVVGVVLQPPGAPPGNLMTMNEMLAMSGAGGESGGHTEDMMPSGLDLIAAAALAQQRMSEQPSKSQSAAASSRNSSRPMTGGEDVPDSQKSPTRSPRRRHSQRTDDAAPIAADEASATTRAEPTSPSLAPTATASSSSPQRSRSKLSASPVNIDRAHSSASQRHLQLSAVEDGVDQLLPTASASATDSAVTTGAVGADDANGEEEEGDEEVVEIPYTTEQIEQLVHTTDTCLDRVRAELEVLRGKMNRFREAKKAAENKAKSILNTRKSQSKKTSDLQAQRDKLLDLNEKLQRIEGGLDRRVALEQRCSEFKVICRKILEGQSLFKAELSKMNEYKEFIERATMSEEQKQQQLLEQQLQAQQQHLAQHEHALPPASDNASSSHLSSLADEINARNAMSAMLSTLPEHSGMQDVGAEFLTPSDYMHQNQQRPISSAAGGDMISAGGTLSELASAHLSPTRSPMPAQTAANDAHRSVSRTEELQKRSKKQNTKSATKSKANVATTSDSTSAGKPKGIRKQKVDSKLEVSGKPSKTTAGTARVGKKSANTLTKKASTQSSAAIKKKQHEHHATAAGSSTQPPKHSHSKHGGSGLVPYSSLGKVRKLTEAQKETHNDYKCLCKRNVFENKPSIQCDMCGFWYHISCCKLTDIEAVAMQEWFCKRCCDKSHINCICFEPEEGDTTPFICCDDCKSWYHYRCVGLDSITVNGLDKWFCGLCCDANDEMRRRFVALRVFILRNPVPEADYAATEEMVKEIRASEYMKSHAKPLLSVSLMHSTVKRFNPSADISKLTYDFTILLTDIKERRFGRMVDVIKAAGAVIDTLREILPSPAASEILQQLDAIDAQLMSSLRQTALKCVFDDAAAQQQAGNVSGGAGVSGGDAATASSSGSGGGSSSGSDDENEGGADQMLTTSVAPDATAAANKKSTAGRSKKHQVVGGTQKTNKNDKSSAGGRQKQASASRKKSAAASAGGTKKVVIGRGGTQRTGKRHHGSLASSTLPIPAVAAPRDDVDHEGLTEDDSNKRHRADEEAQIGHPPSPPVLRDAAEADESGHNRAGQQQQEVNDTVNATVAE